MTINKELFESNLKDTRPSSLCNLFKVPYGCKTIEGLRRRDEEAHEPPKGCVYHLGAALLGKPRNVTFA